MSFEEFVCAILQLKFIWDTLQDWTNYGVFFILINSIWSSDSMQHWKGNCKSYNLVITILYLSQTALHTTWHHITPRDMTSQQVTWRHTKWHDVTPSGVTSRHVVWSHGTSCEVMSRGVTSHHVTITIILSATSTQSWQGHPRKWWSISWTAVWTAGTTTNTVRNPGYPTLHYNSRSAD